MTSEPETQDRLSYYFVGRPRWHGAAFFTTGWVWDELGSICKMSRLDKQLQQCGYRLPIRLTGSPPAAPHATFDVESGPARRFWASESGAITIDWVVLGAGIVALVVLVMFAIGDNLNVAKSHIETELAGTPDQIEAIQRALTGAD